MAVLLYVGLQMSWTSPRTWAVGDMVTGSLLNQYLRDNLLASETSVVAVSGDVPIGSGANTLSVLPIGSAGYQLRSNGTALEWKQPPVTFPSVVFPSLVSISPASGSNSSSGWTGSPQNPDLGGGLRQWYSADSGPSGSSGDRSNWFVPMDLGWWSLWLAYATFPSAATVEVLLDEVVRMTVDMYSASTLTNQTATVTGLNVGAAGIHAVSLRVSGKNALSSGYSTRVSRLSLTKGEIPSESAVWDSSAWSNDVGTTTGRGQWAA